MECPVCEGKLRRVKREFIYGDIVLGEFEAEACDRCGEVFFTEASSDEIDRLARTVAYGASRPGRRCHIQASRSS